MDQTNEFAASLLIVRQAAKIKDVSEFKGGTQRSQAYLTTAEEMQRYIMI